MPRQQRCRKIEKYPDYWSFTPDDAEFLSEDVTLTLDEYESIRLIDNESVTQEQCAEAMGVARTTVTAIYDSARKKLADALVNGKRLRISGGRYRLPEDNIFISEKGNHTMRIAAAYENGEVFQHFGHTEQFKIYDVQDEKIVSEQVVDTSGQGHGALAGFLRGCRADALICGGIGMGAQNALAEAGIKLYAGVQGSADAAAKALAEGSLQYDPNAKCGHHDHHHGGGHDCGHHHGGDHDCGHHHGGHSCGEHGGH